MVNEINRLNARFVETVSKPGRHADGGNLYLSVSPTGAKSWVLFYKHEGRQREMGLGSLRDVSLKAAREAAANQRQFLLEGKDPLTERNRPAPEIVTFKTAADDFIAAKTPGWRNPKHIRQWRQTIDEHAKTLHGLPVDAISTNDVFATLSPIWNDKQETASKLRGRIEAILNAAKARGLRSGENPAAWRGNLKDLLSERKKLVIRGHHRAMYYEDVPAFVRALRMHSSNSARALEFTIATAARSAEVLGARWDEIDLENETWTVPKERMKGGVREHVKPLSSHALTVLGAMKAVRRNEFVFPGVKRDGPLSTMALEMTLRRMKIGATPHGFRSSFRTWASEETDFPNHVCEMALAHEIGSEVEKAYRRGDLLAKRRNLMAAWAAFCEGEM